MDDHSGSEAHERTEHSTLGGDDDGPEPNLDDVHRIGRYLVLRKVGQGGMGVVFAGYDEPLDRKVAIKLLRHRTGDAARRRLAREAQALARLSHPNVVQVYEIGEHDYTAYIAMEFVEGQTLSAWRSARARAWPELLAVMIDAGRGLAAAHHKGLVHRDFKPENVMIDGEGRVRVMDFGLVHGAHDDPHDEAEPPPTPEPPATLTPTELELLDSKVSRSHSELGDRLTVTGSTLGTPAYMAPEQHAGRPTDARSDQFSFCVALWELLYGERPFAGRTLAALCVAVTKHELREPTDSDVPGWLRKIVERGLAAEPRERWPDMDALLVALADDPRRRRGFLLGITGVLGLALAALLARNLMIEREHERLLAQCSSEGEQIQQLWNGQQAELLATNFAASGAAFASDSWSRTRTQLDAYAVEWTELRSASCREATLEHTRTLESLADIHACLDDARLALSATLELLGEAKPELVAYATRLPHELPRLAACSDDVALGRRVPVTDVDAHAQLRAGLQRATALELVGDYRAALALAEQLVARATGLESAAHEAEARLLAGDVRVALGEYALARDEYELGFRLSGKAGNDELALRAATKLAMLVGSRLTRIELGRLWAKVGEMQLLRLGDEHGVDAANLHTSIAQIELTTGNYDAAIASATQALTLYTDALGPSHPDVAIALLGLADAHRAREHNDEALLLLERALQLREDAFGPQHPDVASVLGHIGAVLAERGEFDAARVQQQRALALREAALGPEHPAVASSLVALGLLEFMQGRNAESLPLLERALAIREASLGPDHELVAAVLTVIAVAHMRQGDLERALGLNQRAQVIVERVFGPEHPRVASMQTHIAQYMIMQGRLDEAQAAAERALTIFEATFGHEHGEVANALLGLGSVLEARGDLRGALAQYQRGLALFERVLGPNHHDLTDSLFLVADAHRLLGELGPARVAFERTLALELAAGSGGLRTAETRLALAGVCWDQGDRELALSHARAALDDLQTVEAPPDQLAEVTTWLTEHAR
jgi:serine/threonine protein kinase/Tfp pilus assembly protein PilF